MFNLSVPKVARFVERPAEMANLEAALLPPRPDPRQEVFVLRGLGGVGKTQLAVRFARLHYRRFSSVFWLDGGSEDSIKRSIAKCANRIVANQISDISRNYSTRRGGDLDAVVEEVMSWLAEPGNTEWLLIIDNVDLEYWSQDPSPGAYDLKDYFPDADHGAILVTTRLANLEQLGDSLHLQKADRKQSEDILRSRYHKGFGKIHLFPLGLCGSCT